MLQVAAQQPHGAPAAEEIHYFQTHQQRMQYQRYREQGYPLGSGIVESACKQVILARARQAGMSWRPDNLQAVLTLRAEFLSGRWDTLPSLHRAAA